MPLGQHLFFSLTLFLLAAGAGVGGWGESLFVEVNIVDVDGGCPTNSGFALSSKSSNYATYRHYCPPTWDQAIDLTAWIGGMSAAVKK